MAFNDFQKNVTNFMTFYDFMMEACKLYETKTLSF